MAEYRLEMRGVSKSFPGVKALDKINLKVRPGTVHALMGENGAGKSTLMKCLFGIYDMDEGEVYLDGEKVEIHNPDEALHRGLAMVHQELQPIPERTVAENMYTGRYPTKKFGPIQVIDHKKMFEETAKWLDDVKMPYNPKAKLGTMSIAQMQSVEIAKAVSLNARVVILDEPTSSLTDNEVEALFRIVRDEAYPSSIFPIRWRRFVRFVMILPSCETAPMLVPGIWTRFRMMRSSNRWLVVS